jgi:RNA polymerase sigma-70 factor (ECF subfamily)
VLVHQLIEQLPDKQRQIMQLRDIEEKSYQEIAQELDITEEQVKINLFRARQKVKQGFLKLNAYGL